MTLTAAYDDGTVTLYHGDCREVLALLPEGAADVTITDPPYNCGKDYGETTDDRRPWDEWCTWWDGILDETKRVTPTATFAFLSQTAQRKYARLGKHEADWSCVWNKPLSMAACYAAFLPHWEPIEMWGKARKRDGHFFGFDVFTHNTEPRGHVGHPTPKPLGLMKKIIGRVTKEGETVLDPFAGSGTTLIAARNLGRKAIGIEVSPAYVDVIVRRLRGERTILTRDDFPETAEQPSLFAREAAE